MTREQLYELVWSKPMRSIAEDLRKSDVWLGRVCRRAQVPVPERGYWNKVKAGKRTSRRRLPPRFPGMSSEVGLEHPDCPRPLSDEPPTFGEPVAEVARRAAAIVGKVGPVGPAESQHPLVVALLKLEREDYFVQRGLRAAPSDNPAGRRRLRILGSLLMGFARAGCPSSMSLSRYANERPVTVMVGSTPVTVAVEVGAVRGGKPIDGAGDAIVVTSKTGGREKPRSWTDDASGKLERRLAEIVVAIMVSAEERHREACLEGHRQTLEFRAWAEGDRRRREAEAERARIAAEEGRAKERVDSLLEQASDLHKARTIRLYVEAVMEHPGMMGHPPDDLARWADWARSEADRLDPVVNGTVMRSLTLAPALPKEGPAQDVGPREPDPR